MRILIANRGEIARRVIRTAHRLGHTTVAVFGDPDANAPHVREASEAVRLGPAALAESYLSVDRLLAAAAETGADAVHPGYGFLSENAAFARAVIDADLIWIGPKPDAIDHMGSKIEARAVAATAGVPIIPGFSDSQDPAELLAAAEQIGWPILVKAASGGGGKGIRIATSASEFHAALSEASSEAQRSFDDGDVIVERYITEPRHIEVQVVGDHHGGLAELGTRECSVQRRYQKVLEEAPAPNLPELTRRGLRQSALDMAGAVGYDSAGTVEFIVDDKTGEHFFLEMNTRLQVEHPVTELVTGVDLVEIMIRVAADEQLAACLPDDLAITGHAFEARINAEDAANSFAPQLGQISMLQVPAGVRWDAAIEVGSEITPHYDPMIAKLIVGGSDRETALAALRTALDQLLIGGVVTNAPLHRWLVDATEITSGRVTTRFLDETDLSILDDQTRTVTAAQQAAELWVRTTHAAAQDVPASPWRARPTFTLSRRPPTEHLGLRRLGTNEAAFEASVGSHPAPSVPPAAVVDLGNRRVAININGETFAYELVPRSELWAPSAADRAGTGQALTAPFPAVVAEVHAQPGDSVQADDVLVVIEAMKMLHSLKATGTTTVDEVRVAVGDQVASDQILVTFLTPTDSPQSTEAKAET